MSNKLPTRLEPWSELDNKVVLVTGASSGLGKDLCLDLAKTGCRIIAAARRVHLLHSLCKEINGCDQNLPQRAVAVELDVAADGPSIDRAVQAAWDAFGRIDVLINNAGVRGTVKSPLDLSEDEWEAVLRTNLKGTWLVSKSVCSRLRKAALGGSVINISSIAGTQRGCLPGGLAYGASKAAVNSITKGMALELGEYGIRVNSINPGLFMSEITKGLMEKEWLEKVMFKTMPLRAVGASDPLLTSLVRYLIHDAADYVTGNNFIADAGATLPGVPLFSSL